MATTNPAADLAAFVSQAQSSGEAEADPYSYAMAVVGTVLAFALDDGISGAMSEGEHALLAQLAGTIAANDQASYDQFMGTLGPR